MADESIVTRRPFVSATGEPLQNGPSIGDEQSAQLATLRADIETLKESISVIASTAKNLASASVEDALSDAQDVLKRNVFASVGIAALMGYLWGRTR